MKQNLPSFTAASVAVITSLRWYTGDSKNAILQAELLRNLPRRFMIPFVWIYIQMILCHPFVSKCYLYILQKMFGSSQLCQGVWLRKAYMEQQIRNFLAQHDHQRFTSQRPATMRVIVLAAGYDMLAFRLAHEFPNVNFIELDHPATGEAKLSALSHMCKNSKGAWTMPKNLTFCHEALGDNGCTIRHALERNGIDLKLAAEIPTAVVMEGLSFYLTERENLNVFQEIGQLFGCSSKTTERENKSPYPIVAFDFFNLDRDGRPINPNTTTNAFSSWISSAMKYKVLIVGEPFKWGIAQEELGNFFENTGWKLVPTGESRSMNGSQKIDQKHDDDATPFKYAIEMGIEYVATVQWSPQ